MKTRAQLAIAGATAAGILGLIAANLPQASITPNRVAGEAHSVDVAAITRSAGSLPDQQFPAH
jgi:hypothetical protein